jgi:hypothetical protein
MDKDTPITVCLSERGAKWVLKQIEAVVESNITDGRYDEVSFEPKRFDPDIYRDLGIEDAGEVYAEVRSALKRKTK